MAQNRILMIERVFIFYDPDKYIANEYDKSGGYIAVARYTSPEQNDTRPVVNIYGNLLHWLDTTGITPTQFIGGIRFDLP